MVNTGPAHECWHLKSPALCFSAVLRGTLGWDVGFGWSCEDSCADLQVAAQQWPVTLQPPAFVLWPEEHKAPCEGTERGRRATGGPHALVIPTASEAPAPHSAPPGAAEVVVKDFSTKNGDGTEPSQGQALSRWLCPQPAHFLRKRPTAVSWWRGFSWAGLRPQHSQPRENCEDFSQVTPSLPGSSSPMEEARGTARTPSEPGLSDTQQPIRCLTARWPLCQLPTGCCPLCALLCLPQALPFARPSSPPFRFSWLLTHPAQYQLTCVPPPPPLPLHTPGTGAAAAPAGPQLTAKACEGPTPGQPRPVKPDS
nr:uncharacterized protein LOC111754844 [Cavia porcellus]